MSVSLAACTVVAGNYLAFARVLAKSFCSLHPDIPFYVLLLDPAGDRLNVSEERFSVVSLRDLHLPDERDLMFRYNRQQVAIALKPRIISHLINRGFRSVVFLDPDLLVLSDLTPLLEAVRNRAMVLTPHLTQPPAGDKRVARELHILRCGTYNGGFVGVTDCDAARRFLGWWEERLRLHCRPDHARGLNYDQRWLDYAPSFVPDLYVERSPEYNVAYWNLPERRNAQWRFFHFSGFNPDSPESLTRYTNVILSESDPARELLRRYGLQLADAGWQDFRNWPWTYGAFNNGIPIPADARRLYATLDGHAARFGDPFDSGRDSFCEWISTPADRSTWWQPAVPRLWQFIHGSRQDLRAAFPSPMGRNRWSFVRWVRKYGRHEHGVSAPFVP